MMFALIYYAVSGRKWFKGPRVNIEHMIHSDPVIEGKGNESLIESGEKIGEKMA